MEIHCVEGEILAVQRMTEELSSSGMGEAQASATVRAIAEGLKTFGVTREVLRQELAPIHTRLDQLDEKIDTRFDVLSGRLFYLMLAMIGVMAGVVGTLTVVITGGG